MEKTELSQGFEQLGVPTGHWIQNAMEAPGLSAYLLKNKAVHVCALVNPHSVCSCCYNIAILLKAILKDEFSDTSCSVCNMLILISISLISG